ncbi:hypothetical protein [Micromonospora sp. RTP1Z1]|uniref:hypothetical protein n=1 Tax=Micromonospora sp. RTP1Z1 TaxID=2994043 RepID=UPI0029C6E1FB|nr:hypothetical protein [Micromonospora sp. RTP1Z1]
MMAGLIVLKPGLDWSAGGGLFDWTLEFLIPRVSDRKAAEHLQEIVENNLGSFWLDDVPADTRREILAQWQDGLIEAARDELPETSHKSDVLRQLQDLVELTYEAGRT